MRRQRRSNTDDHYAYTDTLILKIIGLFFLAWIKPRWVLDSRDINCAMGAAVFSLLIRALVDFAFAVPLMLR